MSDGVGSPEGGGPGAREKPKGQYADLFKGDVARLRGVAEKDRQDAAEEPRRKFVEDRSKRAARRKEQRILRGDITPEEVVETPEEGERRIAHEEALQVDTVTGRTRGKRESMGAAVRRVSERPEFRLMGEPRFFLDGVNDAIERDSFDEARRLIRGLRDRPEVNLGDVHEGVHNLIKERIRTLVEGGDAKHFVACIAYLGDHLRQEDLQYLPKDKLKSAAITKAVKEHVISAFKDNYHDPEEVGEQLQRFYGLGLLSRRDVEKIPEIPQIIGPKLIADFRERNSDFVERWLYFRDRFDPRSQTRKELQKLAIERTEEMFRELEDDPRKPLVRLSVFMDIGLVSEKDVRGKTLAGVQKALSLADSYEGPDPDNPDEKTAMENGIRDIRAKFGK